MIIIAMLFLIGACSTLNPMLPRLPEMLLEVEETDITQYQNSQPGMPGENLFEPVVLTDDEFHQCHLATARALIADTFSNMFNMLMDNRPLLPPVNISTSDLAQLSSEVEARRKNCFNFVHDTSDRSKPHDDSTSTSNSIEENPTINTPKKVPQGPRLAGVDYLGRLITKNSNKTKITKKRRHCYMNQHRGLVDFSQAISLSTPNTNDTTEPNTSIN